MNSESLDQVVGVPPQPDDIVSVRWRGMGHAIDRRPEARFSPALRFRVAIREGKGCAPPMHRPRGVKPRLCVRIRDAKGGKAHAPGLDIGKNKGSRRLEHVGNLSEMERNAP